jgi:ATP-dependent Clp protease ATP-binding subunit ClpC
MFERFSDSASRILFVARQEAEGLGSSSVEPEHLLLALLEQPGGVMARLMEDAHVSAAELRQEVVAVLRPSDRAEAEADFRLTDASQRALSYAVEEADSLRRPVHREHILLGILRCEQSAAATLLNNHGVDVQSIRKVIALRPDTS